MGQRGNGYGKIKKDAKVIYAIDLINEQMTLGYRLILNSIEEIGIPVIYVPNSEIEQHDYSNAIAVIFSFMFFDNYLDVAETFRRMKLPLYSRDRNFPICIAGGEPVSDNPEPVVDFFDIFCIGEGEDWIKEAVEIILDEHEKTKILKRIYEEVPGSYVPCFYKIQYEKNETVASIDGKNVVARKGDINLSVSNKIKHTRNCKATNSFNITQKEYLIEYHRGCSRKCAFCSYAHFQHPYRKAKSELVFQAIDDVVKNDSDEKNKIVLTQTNSHHLPVDLIEYLFFLKRMPHYSSCVFRSMLDDWEKTEIWKNNHVYFRFGIEGFSERERNLWGKPISDNELLMLPSMFPEKGHKFKFFFISHLPSQIVADVQSFLAVCEKMSQLTNNFITIDAYVTMLQFKYATPMAYFKKEFNSDVWYYLKENSIFSTRKLKVIFSKNEDEDKFYLRNFLSLANRKAASVLEKGKEIKKDRKIWRDYAENSGINIDAVFSEYDTGSIYCSDHLEMFEGHRGYCKKRYEIIRKKIN